MEILGWRLTKMRLVVIAIVAIIAMVIPGIRRVVWWILPLGSGWDDIVVGVALAILFVVIFVDVWTKRIPVNPYNRKR